MTAEDCSRIRRVGIVVLNYQNFEDTIECLRSLGRITYPCTDTIVVDNDSQNESLKHIHQELSLQQVEHAAISESEIPSSSHIQTGILLVQSSSNRGYAAGNNLGIRVALARGVDYILILNNDTSVDKGFLEPLVQYADSRHNVAAVGPKVVDPKGDIDETCTRRRLTFWDCFFSYGIGRRLFPGNLWARRHHYRGECFQQPRDVDVLSGCCMLIKASFFRQVGLLDENTFLFAEEFILHEKIHSLGMFSAIVPEALVTHKRGQSTQRHSLFARQAERASLRYYLTYYRGYSPIHVKLALLANLHLSDFRPK